MHRIILRAALIIATGTPIVAATLLAVILNFATGQWLYGIAGIFTIAITAWIIAANYRAASKLANLLDEHDGKFRELMHIQNENMSWLLDNMPETTKKKQS